MKSRKIIVKRNECNNIEGKDTRKIKEVKLTAENKIKKKMIEKETLRQLWG